MTTTRKQIQIHYDDAVCGGYKTTRCIRQMAMVPGRYVYVVDRRAVMEGRRNAIASLAVQMGTDPVIKIVKSNRAGMAIDDELHRDGSSNVRRDIVRWPAETADVEHRVLIITAEAMRGTDWTPYAGDHLIIDELFDIFDHEERRSPAAYHHFDAMYDLERVSPTHAYSQVKLKSDVTTLSDFQHDDALNSWAVFHRRASAKPGVFVDVHDWAELKVKANEGGVTRPRKWSWFSLWSPEELAPFGTIWLVANALKHSVMWHLINTVYGDIVEFIPLPPNPQLQKWEQRKLVLQYVTNKHEARKAHWQIFPHHPVMWRDWIAANSDPLNHYWTANDVYRDDWEDKREPADQTAQLAGRIPGVAISPKIAGSNEYRDRTVVSALYRAKASPAEISVYGELLVSEDMLIRSREHEDLIQILFRSNLRVANSTKTVTARLYDFHQVTFLKSFFKEAGFPFEVEIEFIDIGIDRDQRKSMREHALDRTLQRCQTEEEKAEAIRMSKLDKKEAARQREAARRARIKAEKEAAGTLKSRGRQPGKLTDEQRASQNAKRAATQAAKIAAGAIK